LDIGEDFGLLGVMEERKERGGGKKNREGGDFYPFAT